jgi:hypothetical protein
MVLQRAFKFSAFVILSILIAYLAVTTLCVTLDWKTEFLGINPPEKTYIIGRHFDVPIIEVSKSNELSSDGQLLSADIFFQYSGILAEGVPVHIITTGYLYNQGERENVDLVIVGFEGAKFLNYSKFVPNAQTELILRPTDSRSIIVNNLSKPIPSSDIDTTVAWDTQGDYAPYLIIKFKNTTTTPLIIRYPNLKIHVSGSDIIRQEKYSLINTRLSIAIFWLTLITSLSMLCKFAPKIFSWICSENKSTKSDNGSSRDPKQSKSLKR